MPCLAVDQARICARAEDASNEGTGGGNEAGTERGHERCCLLLDRRIRVGLGQAPVRVDPDQAAHPLGQPAGRLDHDVATHRVTDQHHVRQVQLSHHGDHVLAEGGHRPALPAGP